MLISWVSPKSVIRSKFSQRMQSNTLSIQFPPLSVIFYFPASIVKSSTVKHRSRKSTFKENDRHRNTKEKTHCLNLMRLLHLPSSHLIVISFPTQNHNHQFPVECGSQPELEQKEHLLDVSTHTDSLHSLTLQMLYLMPIKLFIGPCS